MELTISLSVIFSIVGFCLSFFFFRKTKIKEVIKAVDVIKTVEVLKVVNQVQVAEIVTTETEQFILGFDYFKRKQVISKKYEKGLLDSFKSGDIFQYTNEEDSAELIFSTVSIG